MREALTEIVGKRSPDVIKKPFTQYLCWLKKLQFNGRADYCDTVVENYFSTESIHS